jgi:hypothetical protein
MLFICIFSVKLATKKKHVREIIYLWKAHAKAIKKRTLSLTLTNKVVSSKVYMRGGWLKNASDFVFFLSSSTFLRLDCVTLQTLHAIQ